MKKILNVSFIVLVFVLSASTMIFADDSFEFHGYARTGFSFNESLHKPSGTIQCPNASRKYRLGNEADNTYIENEFVKNWSSDEGQKFKAVFMYDWHIHETHMAGNDGDDEGVGTESYARVRQVYMQASGLDFAPSLSFWVGQRYYSREDIFINDLYYKDNTGFGAGVEKINLGFAKVNLAWIYAASDTDMFTDGDVEGDLTLHGFDVQLNEISVPGGKLNIEGMVKYLAGGEVDAAGTEEVESQTGFFGQLSYNFASFFGIGKGFAKVVGQVGTGIAAGPIDYGFNTFGTFAHPIFFANNEANSKEIKEYRNYRGIIWGTYDVSDNLSLQPVVLYQLAEKNNDVNEKRTWLSAGVRAKYNVTLNFAMQFEVGYDQTSLESDTVDKTSPSLTKFTVAPTITFDTGFYTRPELRVYATYGMWNDDAKGGVGASENDDDTSAMQFGFQAEAWW